MHSIRMTWAVWLLVLLGMAPAWAEQGTPDTPASPAAAPGAEVPPEPAPRTGWRITGLPLLNFNSDEGMGYGARLLLVDEGDGGQRPYRYSVVAQFFQTTRGVGAHRILTDAPGFLGSAWRVGLDLSLLNERFTPYYGIAGASDYEADFSSCDDRDSLETSPDVCPGNPAFRGLRYYSYEQRTFPSVVLNSRRPVKGPWQVALGYRFRLTRVSARYGTEDLGQSRDSRLEEDARLGLLTGLGGGTRTATFRTAELTAGVLLDLRDNEPAPVRGMFHELAARGAMEATGSAFRYWGTTLNLRFYHPLVSERLVAALRLMGDVMGGDVPFFLLNAFGGVEWRDGWGGIGGVFTGRGILKNRVQGKVKALANGELRWLFLSTSPFNQKVDFTAVAFLDAGQAWADLDFRDDGLARYAGGGGLRISWDRNFIVRLDYGVSPSDGTSGFYLDFNHLF
ncbi:BamA/TamA family outer membrane protein [Myxococcus sp. RHSTA-1-4]|uniref:Omp85 family outer membrane protein n=1 Tax=Myxococcus sp. RHSTA-1-4 TaxID=2874601 RepID=UPI001CC00F08|nr:BamA/TamA family outer membrane protein [Myxococcus sp. RHSTA-1-4]MBZ4419017.1 outer membrane protein assembly factor [Myxococcus sp. RHSTA-1-4]